MNWLFRQPSRSSGDRTVLAAGAGTDKAEKRNTSTVPSFRRDIQRDVAKPPARDLGLKPENRQSVREPGRTGNRFTVSDTGKGSGTKQTGTSVSGPSGRHAGGGVGRLSPDRATLQKTTPSSSAGERTKVGEVRRQLGAPGLANPPPSSDKGGRDLAPPWQGGAPKPPQPKTSPSRSKRLVVQPGGGPCPPYDSLIGSTPVDGGGAFNFAGYGRYTGLRGLAGCISSVGGFADFCAGTTGLSATRLNFGATGLRVFIKDAWRVDCADRTGQVLCAE